MKIMQINNSRSLEIKNKLQTNFNSNFSRALDPVSQQPSEDVVEISSSVNFQSKQITKRMLKPMIKAGKSKTKIAAELGIAKKTLDKFLQQYGLEDCFRKSATHDVVIDRVALQKLADEEKTLNEMAEALNTTVSLIRRNLAELQISRPNLEELALSRRYYSAKTPQEKANVFVEVDKILEQIAREEYQADRVLTFEDALQDVRLRFAEIVGKKQDGKRFDIRNIFRAVRESRPMQQKEASAVKLGYKPVKTSENDPAIMRFEKMDYIKSCIDDAQLYERERIVFEKVFKENKPYSEIGDMLGLMPERIKQILERAITKVKSRRLLCSEEDVLQQKIEFANKVVKDIITRMNEPKPAKKQSSYSRLIYHLGG